MTYAYTHPLPTCSAVECPPLPKPESSFIRARAAFATLFAALTMHELPADRVYGSLLESSGGKLTDALEREADRRLRDG